MYYTSTTTTTTTIRRFTHVFCFQDRGQTKAATELYDGGSER